MPDERLLFLSHSGIDTEDARELKRRIESSPSARRLGLKVWFDKDDLDAGKSWQRQLEQAIQERCTAFAVYVGSKGVMNWVESEVSLGLARGLHRPIRRPTKVDSRSDCTCDASG